MPTTELHQLAQDQVFKHMPSDSPLPHRTLQAYMHLPSAADRLMAQQIMLRAATLACAEHQIL